MDKKKRSMKKYFLTLIMTIFTFSLVLGYAGPTVTIKAETQEEELEKLSEELEKLGAANMPSSPLEAERIVASCQVIPTVNSTNSTASGSLSIISSFMIPLLHATEQRWRERAN